VTHVLEVDPYAGDRLAQRLQQLDIPLPADLARVGAGMKGRARPAARARRQRRGWRVAAAVGVAAAGSVLAVGVFHVGSASTVTLHVPGFTVEVAASTQTAPHLTGQQATAVALALMAQHPVTMTGTTPFTGFVVTGATYESDVIKVWETCGAHWFLPQPMNLWVIDLAAPAQLGSTYVRGSVLVDDQTGQARYSDFLTGKAGPAGC
jgi:hypothetical protein